MLPESVYKSSNIVKLSVDLNPIDYIRSFKLGSMEMVHLQNHFEHPKAGPILQYLCHMHYVFEYPENGFNWPVLVSNRRDGKSIAKNFGIKSMNTIQPILNEVRVYRKFAKGEFLDPTTIDFEGKYFAAYHNGRTNDVRWFPNLKALHTLSEFILHLGGHTQPLPPKKGTSIDAELKADCIPFDSELTPNCKQIGGSYTNVEVLGVWELEKEGEKDKQPEHPVTNVTVTTPFAPQKKSVGEDKKTENQKIEEKKKKEKVVKEENLEKLEIEENLATCEKEENFIKEEKSFKYWYGKDGREYMVEITEKEAKDAHWKQYSAIKAYVTALEEHCGLKGVQLSPQDRGCLNNVQKRLYELDQDFLTHHFIFDLFANWEDFQEYAKDKYNSQLWWVAKDSYMTPSNIIKNFSIIYKWEMDRHYAKCYKLNPKATLSAKKNGCF